MDFQNIWFQLSWIGLNLTLILVIRYSAGKFQTYLQTLSNFCQQKTENCNKMSVRDQSFNISNKFKWNRNVTSSNIWPHNAEQSVYILGLKCPRIMRHRSKKYVLHSDLTTLYICILQKFLVSLIWIFIKVWS